MRKRKSVSLPEETQARQAALHTERMDLLAAMVQELRGRLAEAEAERDRNGRIISVLVEDAGGEVMIPIGRLEAAYPITLNQDGEGRDDELTITVLYP